MQYQINRFATLFIFILFLAICGSVDLKGFIVDNLLITIFQLDIINRSATQKIEMKAGNAPQVF
jgi:hypothetical protein